MDKTIKGYIFIVIIAVLIIPQVTFAAWWNPVTWFNNWTFQEKEAVQQTQTETQKTPEDKIAELQKQVDDLKKQQTNPPATKTPVAKKKITPEATVPVLIQATTTSTLNNTTKDTTPYVDLKVNGQDGPVTVQANSSVDVSWTSANVVFCSSGAKNGSKPLNGTETIYVNASTNNPFKIGCMTLDGTVVSDSVVLNIINKTSDNSDPYGVLYNTGNAYTPEQLDSIDCAYYGRNCPTVHVKIDN